MNSHKSRRMLKRLMRLRPLLRALKLEISRKAQDALGAFTSRSLRKRVVLTPEPFNLFEAVWATPVTPAREGVILYLHGGGYVMGSITYVRSFGGALAQKLGRVTLGVAYRLAPEDPFPAALDDAVNAYLRLCERYPNQRVAIVGESAGGGLCFSLACRLRELKLPAPDCIAAFSPWTDLTASGASCEAMAEQDPCLSLEMLQRASFQYAGDDTANPLVSPLFADLSDMPPAIIYVGSQEMLLDDAVRMAERYQQAGSACELHVAEGLWHVYPFYNIPESEQAIAGVNIFLDTHLS